MHILHAVSLIIMKYSRWPNAFFVADDPCAILFWDSSVDMTSVHAMRDIEEELSVPSTVFENLGGITFGELLLRILEMRHRGQT
jgi:hypothetical protein